MSDIVDIFFARSFNGHFSALSTFFGRPFRHVRKSPGYRVDCRSCTCVLPVIRADQAVNLAHRALHGARPAAEPPALPVHAPGLENENVCDLYHAKNISGWFLRQPIRTGLRHAKTNNKFIEPRSCSTKKCTHAAPSRAESQERAAIFIEAVFVAHDPSTCSSFPNVFNEKRFQ